MAINLELVGKQYPPMSYEVGREKIREFADAVADPNPAYRDARTAQALGYPDVVAPPTFAVVVTRGPQLAVIDDDELGLDFSRVVHGDQRFAYHRPIVAGDRLTVVATVESARTVAGNDIVTIRSDVAGPDAEPVVTVWATLVARAVEKEG
jgi:acyl dehydratase